MKRTARQTFAAAFALMAVAVTGLAANQPDARPVKSPREERRSGPAPKGPITPDPLPIEPPEHPFLRFSHAEDWSIIAQIQLLSCNQGVPVVRYSGVAPQVSTEFWEVEGGRLWFPFVGAVAGSVPFAPDAGQPFGAELYAGGHRQPIEARLVDFGEGTSPCVEVEFGSFRATQVRARFEFLRRSWRVDFDERKAASAPWPSSVALLPPEAQAALAADYAVPVDRSAPVEINPARAVIERWTNGIDPKSRLGPAVLAKFLTARVIEHVQPARRGAVSRVGVFQGFNVPGPEGRYGAPPIPPDAGWRALVRERGSDVEVVTALVAVLRQAEIPARLVIGVRSTLDDERRVIDDEERNPIAVWAEFYIQNERKVIVDNEEVIEVEGGWIPIDIVRQRQLWSNRPQPLDVPWQFFGNNDQGDLYVPVSHHFFPITDSVYYGPPALYGWQTQPATPGCGSHEVILEVERPTRGGPSGRPIIQVGR